MFVSCMDLAARFWLNRKHGQVVRWSSLTQTGSSTMAPLQEKQKPTKRAPDEEAENEPPAKKQRPNEEVEKDPWAGKVVDPGVAFDAKKHAPLLGIPYAEPPRPVMPSESEMVTDGDNKKLQRFIKEVHAYVEWKLSVFLFECKEVQLRKPLKELTTPDFQPPKDCNHWVPTTYMAQCDMQSCEKSLEANSVYEAMLTCWQLELTQGFLGGIELGVNNVGWKQVCACAGLWGLGFRV